jgi:hypothetical protein
VVATSRQQAGRQQGDLRPYVQNLESRSQACIVLVMNVLTAMLATIVYACIPSRVSEKIS